MKVCDICKSEHADYNDIVTIDDKGNVKRVELCASCYRELSRREALHKHQAYIETVEAMTGKRPRKTHWWNSFI